MDGEIRSAFLMTEPAVASSDATNIETSIVRDGDEYVINGRKWWSSGMGDPRCKVMIVMGKTDPSAPNHQAQSQILVPADAKGVKVEKMLPVFGFDDAPHGHAQVLLENVRVPVGNILLGEGRGFEIAQGRLGPGRIHHCMRTIGKAEEALEKMVRRLSSRTAFGRKIIEYSIWEQRIAEARTDIEMNRLLCLKAADMMDKVGNKTAQLEIAMIKVSGPNMALRIIDNAIQAYGAAGVSDDAGLARDYASMRTMRLADGPDEVHNRAIARLELRKYANAPTSLTGASQRSLEALEITVILRSPRSGRLEGWPQTPSFETLFLRTAPQDDVWFSQASLRKTGSARWPRASGKTRNFPAPGRSRSVIASTRCASTAGCANTSRVMRDR